MKNLCLWGEIHSKTIVFISKTLCLWGEIHSKTIVFNSFNSKTNSFTSKNTITG